MEKMNKSERKAQMIAKSKVAEIKTNINDLTEEQYLELYNKELNFARTEIEKRKEKRNEVIAFVIGALGITAASVLGFNFGVKYMDKMICKGAMKGGIHKNLKNGGRIVCKYFSKEEMAEMAKEVTKEVVKG